MTAREPQAMTTHKTTCKTKRDTDKENQPQVKSSALSDPRLPSPPASSPQTKAGREPSRSSLATSRSSASDDHTAPRHTSDIRHKPTTAAKAATTSTAFTARRNPGHLLTTPAHRSAAPRAMTCHDLPTTPHRSHPNPYQERPRLRHAQPNLHPPAITPSRIQPRLPTPNRWCHPSHRRLPCPHKPIRSGEQTRRPSRTHTAPPLTLPTQGGRDRAIEVGARRAHSVHSTLDHRTLQLTRLQRILLSPDFGTQQSTCTPTSRLHTPPPTRAKGKRIHLRPRPGHTRAQYIYTRPLEPSQSCSHP